MASAPLRTIRNSNLIDLYRRLLLGENLETAEKKALLVAAVIFLNDSNQDLQSLGYRIIILYSNLTKDFVPLSDVALGKGFMPIVRSIENLSKEDDDEKGFFPEFFSSLVDLYQVQGAIFTEQQLHLSSFFEEHSEDDVTITAPTSYGKSELISNFCNRNLNASVCIVVPTKALLAQTKQRLLRKRKVDDNRQIITHPEMFQGGEQNIIAVFTQERLLRMFVKHPSIHFNFVFVDEAHNLLGDNQRALLLASVIILQKKRAPNSKVKYLTPFLVDNSNLQLRYQGFNTNEFKVQESLKTEKYHLNDFRKERILYLYDQYFDQFVTLEKETGSDPHEFIRLNSANKNILFFNKPKHIQKFTRDFIQDAATIDGEEIEKAVVSITEFLHKDYLLVNALRKGVLYHHGSVPDIIKLYIERIFSKIKGIQYILCNSTLLEGVNIPAERLFLLENKIGNKNLSKSQFRNLVGRICRFNEIFSEDSKGLSLLEPHVFLLGTEEYTPAKANLNSFIKNVAQVDLKISDDVENLLLDQVSIENQKQRKEKAEADIFLEHVIPGITDTDVSHASTEVGRLGFLNNITEIDLLASELKIEKKIQASKAILVTTNEVLDLISSAFIPHLKESGSDYYLLKRLEEPAAQSFYSMLLDWKMRGASYAEMINHFLRYWEEREDKVVFVGRNWGDLKRDESYTHNWVDISEKTPAELVNLAIVRIIEEQGFVDNFLMKFIETLNDLKKLDADLYLKIKYGTTNMQKIELINSGINSYLASKLIETYSDYVNLDAEMRTVELRPDLINKMRENNENDILVFEAELHIGLKD
ncbi:MAG: hypothetical protein DHS20C08_16150 [Rhodomicrobium sp.]|nr:MAG: hypothetical protein DHS20C08_16150 [Rhodomicrobium sp.]